MSSKKKLKERENKMKDAILAAKKKTKKQGGGGADKVKMFGFKEDDDDILILLSKQYEYMYANRQCGYRSEQLEISPIEFEQIRKLQSNDEMKYDPYSQILSISSKKPTKIIIDTDIGTDIDDVLTLLLLSHLKPSEVELIGITTNYRPTLLRKYIAEQILQQTKNNDFDLSTIPVVAGSCYLCGSHRPFYYAGNEGKGLGIDVDETHESNDEKKQENLMKSLWDTVDNTNAEDFIYKKLCEYPSEITIISIGIPTNIGNLVHKYGTNKIESLIGHIVVMGGGCFMHQKTAKNAIGSYCIDSTKWKTKMDKISIENKALFKIPKDYNEAIKWMTKSKNVIHLFPNHNVSGDTLASSMMFSLHCPISLIPHDITKENILEGIAIETLLLLATKSDVEKRIYEDNENGICGVLLREWLRVRVDQRCQCLHDPLTFYEAVYTKQCNDDFKLQNESCLKYCNGTIIVHEWAAFITFVPNKNGPHRIAYKCINSQKFVKWCSDTLINNVSKQNITDNAGDLNKIML